MVTKTLDIFDEVADSEDLFDVTDTTEEDSIKKIKSEISSVLDRFDNTERKAEKALLTSELKALIKEEIAKIKPVQNIIERQVEQIIKHEQVPVHLEPKIIQAPPPPPQIIKEVRVEVQTEKKDTTKYVELSKYQDLLIKFGKLEAQLKETRRMAESPIVVGGSGVIGIPPPEPNPDGYVLTVSKGKAAWKVSTGGGGGLTPGTFSISNNTPEYTFDPTASTVDSLYQIVATLIRTLQGEI